MRPYWRAESGIRQYQTDSFDAFLIYECTLLPNETLHAGNILFPNHQIQIKSNFVLSNADKTKDLAPFW